MALQDFFEGAIRTGVAAANSYLDAELAFLQAKDAQSKEAARQKLVEERNRLMRQKQNFDQLMRMAEYQSKEAVNAREAEESKRKQEKEEKLEKSRQTNISKFGEASSRVTDARSKYRESGSDEDWDIYVSATDQARSLGATMGDDVDLKFLDTMMNEETVARDKTQTEADEMEKEQAQDEVDIAVNEYLADMDNEELAAKAQTALFKGVRMDADNQMYKSALGRLFPDADAVAYDEASAAFPGAKETYEFDVAALMDDPDNPELKQKVFKSGSAYGDIRGKMGMSRTMIDDSLRDLNITQAPEADDDTDAPLADANRTRARENIERLLSENSINEDEAQKLRALLDVETTTKKSYADAINKVIMEDEKPLSKEERDNALLEGYDIRSDNHSLLEKLIIDDHSVIATTIDKVLGKRKLAELSEDDKNFIADKVISVDVGPPGTGEVEGRIRRAPLLIAERLAVVEQAFEKVADKLDLSTAFTEAALEKFGESDDPDVVQFATVAQLYRDDVLRLSTGAQANVTEIQQGKKVAPNVKNREERNRAIIDGLKSYHWGMASQDFAKRFPGEWGGILSRRHQDNVYKWAKEDMGRQDDGDADMLASYEADRAAFVTSHKNIVQQLVGTEGYDDVQAVRDEFEQSFTDAGIPDVAAVLAEIFDEGGDE